jgi:hypothetical protein
VEELSPIAHPLAQRKLLKKLNKAVKNGGSCLILPYLFTDANAPKPRKPVR